VVDGHAIPQSGAILEFLEETHPEKPLLPRDPFARAQVRNLCAIIGCDIQPIQNLTVQIKVREVISRGNGGGLAIELVL
jgi:maleylacetoacetate isomerase